MDRVMYGIAIACLVCWLLGGWYTGFLAGAVSFALLGWVCSRSR